MEPLRVLMINSKMQCAGIENFLMNYYRHMDKTQIQFDFLVHWTERQYFDEEIEAMGGRIYRLSLREDYNVFAYLCQLNAFFRAHPEYRIVHGHMESFGQFYFREAQKAGVPVRIAHAHVVGVDKSLKGFIKKQMNEGFGTYANYLFACSKQSGEYLFGTKRPIRIIPNAIDGARYAFNPQVRDEVRQELRLEGRFVVGHAGRFDTVKNQRFLLEAFAPAHAERPELMLLLAGDGPTRLEMERRAKELGITDNVIFAGLRRDMYRVYQAMDLFVLPSLGEALPYVAIEAQTSGLNCLFSEGVSRETAVLPGSHFLPLKTAIWKQRLVDARANEYRMLGREQLKNAGFDLEDQARKLMELYRSILEGATNDAERPR